MAGRLVQEATKEWIPDGFLDTPDDILEQDRVKCSLCGKPDTKLVFYIENVHNKRRMNVGSSCIHHFRDMKSPDGKSLASYIRGVQSAVNQLRREAQLDRRFPGIASLINGWKDRILAYPVMVPDKYASRYHQLGEQLKSLFDTYVKGKSKIDPTDRITALLASYETQITDMETYVVQEDAKIHPFVARRRIADWLYLHGQHQAIEWLRRDGEIRWCTAHRICEPNFMADVMAIFNDKFNDTKLTFQKVDEDRRGYNFTISPLDTIVFFIRHDHLIVHHGGFMTNEDDQIPTADQLVAAGEIIKSDVVAGTMVQQLNRKLARSAIQIIDVFAEYDEMYASNRATRTVHQLTMTHILNRFKTIVLDAEPISEQAVQDEIRRGKPFTIEDYEQLLTARDPLEKGEKRDMSYVFGSGL